ncbi:MAG: 4Fe-4S dicluster domain-containing protein [Bryobacteraceae bacterium]|nr:4Fe-4S dicluster domain-containing protein [Bryobacteraceae bacterium]
MAASEIVRIDKPALVDLDRCVHCGLCLNACPTYRELGLEMDSPRGRLYQMVKVAEGEMQIGSSYVEHIGLCLACRGCESACPSGVQYGRLVESARAEIEAAVRRPFGERLLRRLVFGGLLPSRKGLQVAGRLLWLYQRTGLQRLVRATGALKLFGNLARAERLAPTAEMPSFFRHYGKVFPPDGARRYMVAFLGGCIANVTFARLNEATIRVLQKNGCEVVVPPDQTCCGALHVHAGLREQARNLARRNIDAFLAAGYDAIVTNAAGCGSTLKEYHELLADDPRYRERAERFSTLVKDVTEFLASVELNQRMGPVPATVTYQDSCHLAHGQKVRIPPRKLLKSVPQLRFKEMPLSDICCGSAGIYNVIHNDMAMALLENKMEQVNRTGADIVVTANPGCLLQLRAGAAIYGRGQRVAHVVEILDEAYRNARG